MKPAITIAEPCHEDWNKMTAEQQGRHCQVCCKTVVDFSKKTDTQVADYLKAKAGQRVCGRFRASQVIIPAREARPVSKYRLFTAALVFVFGSFLFSCSSAHSGEPEIMGTVAQPDTVQTGVTKHMQEDSTTTGIKKVTPVVVEIVPEEPHFVGLIDYDPLPDTTATPY